MIEAKIVEDSVSKKNGIRLTTFVLTYPRFIHAEFMTHRMFSRNASSSRAIPVKKQIKMVRQNPAMPLAFKANKSGMQAGESFGPLKQWMCRVVWRSACYAAVFFATLMEKLNIHKQYANRILEPFSHITVVCSATEYANFFALRYHPMAHPEICELAKQMWETYSSNTPKVLKFGQWHLPFITDDDIVNVLNNDGNQIGDVPDAMIEQLIRSSVARCARVSYLNHEGKKPSFEEDNQLYKRLVGSFPIHASPAEHQALCLEYSTEFVANFKGWVQHRKMLKDENIETYSGPESNEG